jgi:hypothetical protein
MIVTNQPSHDGAVKGDDIVIFNALCCAIDSCFCKFPECLGCYSKRVLMCLESEVTMYKPMCCAKDLEKKNLLCICLSGQCSCIHCKTCCKGESQLCCLDSRFACPCDEEVPCVCTLLPFCTCYPSIGCCKKVSDVQAGRDKKVTPGH